MPSPQRPVPQGGRDVGEGLTLAKLINFSEFGVCCSLQQISQIVEKVNSEMTVLVVKETNH